MVFFVLILGAFIAPAVYYTKNMYEKKIEKVVLFETQYIKKLAEDYSDDRAIEYLHRKSKNSELLYLYVDSNGNKTGNITSIERESDGDIEVEYKDDDLDVFGKSVKLSNGNLFVSVGSDFFEQNEDVLNFAIAALATLFVTYLAIALIFSRRIFKNISEITTVSRYILETGDLTTRIAYSQKNGEFKELLLTLNQMFERVEHLFNSNKNTSNNIAHDLRTPLTRLRNQLEQVQLDNNSDGIELAIYETDQLLATFQSLLSISKIESLGRIENPIKCNLTKIVADVVEMYGPIAEDAGKKIEIVNSNELITYGDKHLLFQSIANIVDNAVKYSVEKSMIEVNIYSNSIHVSNECSEISSSDMEKVFERFYRVDKSRNREGHGLGLSLVKAIAEAHSITIRTSQSKGKFNFTLSF